MAKNPREVVLTFSRTHFYQLEVNGDMLRELASHLDLTARQLNKHIDDETLFDEFSDEITKWIDSDSESGEITEEGTASDVECEYVNG